MADPPATFVRVQATRPRVRVCFRALPPTLKRFQRLCDLLARYIRSEAFTEWVYDVSEVALEWKDLPHLTRLIHVYVSSVLKPERARLAAFHGTLIITASPAMRNLVTMAVRLVNSGAPKRCVLASKVDGEGEARGAEYADAWFKALAAKRGCGGDGGGGASGDDSDDEDNSDDEDEVLSDDGGGGAWEQKVSQAFAEAEKRGDDGGESEDTDGDDDADADGDDV